MKANTFFDNPFSSDHITTTRLHNFADITITRLQGDNTSGSWSAIIALLQPAADLVGDEIGVVDTTINIRMGHTDTVDGIMKSFSKSMSEQEPFIARAVGGKTNPAYLEFYPAGLTEYARVTKTNAPTLMGRISTAAGKYAAQLGQPLAAELQGFDDNYDAARNVQQGTKGSVAENRSRRTDARKALELLLLRAAHQVGDKYPGDMARCKSYFEFDRLYSSGRHRGNGA